MQPLTHHEIVELIGPLTRRGHRVDLDASRRVERLVAFEARECQVPSAEPSDCSERLLLDCSEPARLRLTRVLDLHCGLQARLQLDGASLDTLIALVDAVPPERQFRSGPGYAIALSQRVAWGARADVPPAMDPVLTLVQGEALVDGLTLTLKASPVRGYAAEIELRARAGDTIELPEDLLAVMGWNWGLLSPSAERWTAKVQLRGPEPARSRRGEAALTRASAHLARTLAEPPRSFHQRQFWARWLCALRRAVPLLACLGLVAAAAAVPKLPIAPDSVIRMMIFNMPPLLLVLCFALQELPRFEIPPIPRANLASHWRERRGARD